MTKKVDIALAKIGMNTDSHPYTLDESQYTYAKNANVENESGNSINITNEKSNILATKFKEGFKVIHVVNDIDTSNTYFFLVNPETGVGEFGVVENNQNVNDLEDLTVNCDECSQIKELAEPLENLEQLELQTYTTLISDACKEDKTEGFNFNILNPIKKSVIKNEKCGKTIYFSHKGNPPRYINIDKIADYFIQEVSCGDDIVLNCPDFDKMRVFKLFDIPNIIPVSTPLGGNLKMGNYEFMLAYSDSEGNEISEYYSITNPIRIFDSNNNILSQPEIASRTNYAIKLNVTGLDNSYTHYKVAVRQTTDVEGATRYFVEGVHSINDTTIIYASEQDKEEISVDKLLEVRQKVEEAEGVATANNILYQYGITNKKELNLQPVVNFLGELAVKWQTHIALEDLYEDGVLSAKYLGYNRDEVVPFGIKFLLEGGFETAVFPLIGRTAKETDLETISAENKDRASLESNLTDCNSSLRDKRWQIYNTATVDDTPCDNEGIETVEVTQVLNRFCIVEDVATIPTGTLTTQPNTPFTTLEDYINDNRGESEAECDEAYLTSTVNICDYLYDDYSAIECASDPFAGITCDTPTVVDEFIEVQDVQRLIDNGSFIKGTTYTIKTIVDAPNFTSAGASLTPTVGEVFTCTTTTTISVGNEATTQGEEVVDIYKTFPTDYAKVVPVEQCNPYELNTSTGNPINDTTTQTFLDKTPIYFRSGNFNNEDCSYAPVIPLNQNPISNNSQGYFFNYYRASVIGDLYDTTRTTTATSSGFNTNIHKGALWFKGEIGNREEFIVDISKQKNSSINDYYDTLAQTVRVSIFKTCASSSAIFAVNVDLDSGGRILFRKNGADVEITNEAGVTTTVTGEWFFSEEFFIAIDNKIETVPVETFPGSGIFINRYTTTPPKGCFTVSYRDTEIKYREVTWDSITLQKKIQLEATCTFNQPVVQSCQAIPYKKGDFAYWESLEEYPDNDELYNSSSLNISQSDIPLSIRDKFEEIFATPTVEGAYIWKVDDNNKEIADFTCRNIRHFKMPDNYVSPFMWDNQQASFADSIIFPLGITINESIINSFLDIAQKNNLISKKDRQSIVGYEVVRGDLTLDRSVVASGLLYDMRKYDEKGKEILYPNYPFNSYSQDKLNNITQSGFGEANNNWTFHSPETDYYRPTLTTEMSVQAYMFGNSSGHFDEVLEHPKFVVLSQQARDLAGFLAGLEVAAEAIIAASQALSNGNSQTVVLATGTGVATAITVPLAPIASTTIIAFSTIEAALFKFGRYRYEWLRIFRDLGSPRNFAYYYYAKGHYNYLNLLQSEGDRVRGLNISKYLNDGRFTTNNEVTAQILDVNNLLREKSVFLSTGDFNLEYPTTYSNFDKDNFTSSLTYSGEAGISNSGKSEEIIRNIASPYIFLKNYLPQQHGTLNTVKWLTTGYRGDLRNPRTDCLSIFGGDTFISRHTLKRKYSQFLVSTMGQADRTPFNYFFYNNIGKNPKFYLSSGIDKDFSSGGKIFPDIDDDFSFDNSSRSGNYYKPPSKFYLYYYGIPSFLCETRINTNYRYAERSYDRQFYPQVGDLGDWTQEKNVSIRQPNWFFYNKTYSNQAMAFKNRKLAQNYNKNSNECRADFPNGIVSSLPDNSENNTFDPWLIYRGADFYEFRTDYGKLIDVQGIENEAILARFENTSILFNKVDYTNDDGQSPSTNFLGGTSVFQRRSASFYNAQLGFGGTQNTTSVSCEFGHFHVDAKRGQVIQMQPSGQQMEEISSIIGGKPSGKRQWFKEHLPFKILKYFKDVDVDNNFNGVGISMGWDSRYRRVFITKKDYIPKSTSITHTNGRFFLGETEVFLTDATYFEDVSWTICYSPVYGSWMSYYDFKPNYYVNHNNYFQTGLNSGEGFGLWSHGLTNKSYGVFYGTKYSFDVEYPIKSEYAVKRLNSVSLWTEAKRYHNEYDWAISPLLTFNKSLIHNNVACSGYLNLIPQKNNFAQNKNYPKTNTDNTQDILITNSDNFKWSFDYFFNRVNNNVSNIPFINYDKNQIEKTVNNSIVSFKGKRLLDRLEGDFFLNRLSFDKDSRFSLTLKFTLNEVDI